VPVWHARTAEARAADELVLIGITEEQHPDRCALFAAWQDLDWPILWDPFNLTESSSVPIAIAIDEHGIVRDVDLSLDGLDDFLASTFEPPAAKTPQRSFVRQARRGPDVLTQQTRLDSDEALARLLWPGQNDGPSAADFEVALAALQRATEADASDSRARFRLGVALRLRHDSPWAKREDFQAALDLWGAALRANPSQYIWRRRIQQWGPRLDKPYPFYGWVEEARAALLREGREPPPVLIQLTSSERSGQGGTRGPRAEEAPPDPDGKVPRDESGWVELDVTVVPHTEDQGKEQATRGVQVHLSLRPSVRHAAHWSGETGPVQVWLEDAAELGLERALLSVPVPASEESLETLRADFTVQAGRATTLHGTAYYFVCGGKDGECRFLAQEFEVDLRPRQ